jgi:two-component system alkaline phosphatase synthesis response regulator PhoP
MKKKILLVDDEPDIVAVFGAILENNDYQVITACDGVEGLKKAIEGKPDLIILDMTMPNKSGVETLRELKHSKLTKRIPVVMLTASFPLFNTAGCLELGAKDYLFKTCETQTLLECVKKYVL